MNPKILTVDDSASIRLTTRVALTNASYAVSEATNGAEGLAKTEAEPFDLIATDLNMPVMDGLAMIEELRKIPSQTGIPIIFLTTEVRCRSQAVRQGDGATGWLTKPFDPENLVKIVRKVLGK